MTVLSNSDLQNLCAYLVNVDKYYWNECNWFLNDIYQTGCRSMELFRIERWSIIDEDYLQLTPFKGNYNRTFLASDFSSNFVAAVASQIKPYNGLTLRQLMFLINRYSYYPQIYHHDKPIDAYLFRYNRVKQLKEAGYTDSYVQSYFGWLSVSMVSKYNNAELYYI